MAPRYCITPGDMLDDARISDLHVRVMSIFGQSSDNNGWLQANQRVIAEKCGRTRETVNRVISDLVEWGYLRKQQRFSGKDGRQMINDYQVVMDGSDHREASAQARFERDLDAPPRDPHVTPPVIPTSHHTNDLFLRRPLSPGGEEVARGDRAEGEFDEFWASFPNKVGKAKAAKDFATARRRASFDKIMAGLHRYAGKVDDRPWCNPSTFLNQDRWEDQPAAPSRLPARTIIPRAAPARPQSLGEIAAQKLSEIQSREKHLAIEHK